MNPASIGIIGAGAAGLYAAMSLQKEGHNVHIFEATSRVGGRIFTHYFNPFPNQYFEAGAMRVPLNASQDRFIQVVNEVNSHFPVGSPYRIELIDYILQTPQNRIFVNGVHKTFNQVQVQGVGGIRPNTVGWPDITRDNQVVTDDIQTLLRDALEGLVNYVMPPPDREWSEDGFWDLVREYDHLSFRAYLITEKGWPNELIDYLETIASQTNQYNLSVTELVMQNMDFDTAGWKTIDGGMQRLPAAMEQIIGTTHISYNARVTGIEKLNNGRTRLHVAGLQNNHAYDFQKVIVAIPPAALRVLKVSPAWPPDKNLAIRAIHFEALWKMGMRFKTRFWETAGEVGGQSVTDLPIRWIVLPSNGTGQAGSGVLLLYAWMTDAQNWLPLDKDARLELAIRSLSQVYEDVNIQEELMEAIDVTWASHSSTGDAMFLPGHWATHYQPALRPEGDIHFAGEHLSYKHTWIAGAIESADRVVEEIQLDLASRGYPAGVPMENQQPVHLPQLLGEQYRSVRIGPEVTILR